MEKTWEGFLDYCLQRNVTERDFWIFVVLGVIGVSLIVLSWIRAVQDVRYYRKHEEGGEAVCLRFLVPGVVTGFIGPLVTMGLVNVMYFWV